MKNGDRSYKQEIKPGENIGSYNVLDSQKVSLGYAGQQQTCGHCHETPKNCKGRGIAKKCRAKGGARVEFTDYILDLWKKIGYSPQNVDIADDMNENIEPETENQVAAFTQVKANITTEVYAGVNIRQCPKEYDQGEVLEFLCRNGLPESNKDEIVYKPNGTVTVKKLDDQTSKLMIEAIHDKENFGRKLFWNGFIP
jgi:hypothetical protein